VKKNTLELTTIGWREWISFPEWGIEAVKVKVDTGARTSSLHVMDMTFFEKDSRQWVQFIVHPWQETAADAVSVTAPVITYKEVRSSSGCLQKRPVIRTRIVVAHRKIAVDITLTNRSEMGFRMLLGRAAIRNRFMVIPGKSYLGGRPSLEIRDKNRGVH
jgi:hypothetical protein